jgi:tRNA pseudouridine55 synthase
MPVTTDRMRPLAWLVDKPAGPTSHDVVRDIRRRLPRGTKVGHAGTLDPFATGLLVILAGRATRLADRVARREKSYLATVRLGARSETGDPEGPITPGSAVPGHEAIYAAVAELAEVRRQRVPLYSAVHVDGRRLYEAARSGERPQTPERDIHIHRLAVVEITTDPPTVTLDVEVSKGTYVRQLSVDLGELLGCGAYCLALRRTAVGPLTVVDAVPPDRVPNATPLPLTTLLADMPTLALTAQQVDAVTHGRAVTVSAAPGELAVVDMNGQLVAIGRSDGDHVRPVSVFADPETS